MRMIINSILILSIMFLGGCSTNVDYGVDSLIEDNSDWRQGNSIIVIG